MHKTSLAGCWLTTSKINIDGRQIFFHFARFKFKFKLTNYTALTKSRITFYINTVISLLIKMEINNHTKIWKPMSCSQIFETMLKKHK